MELKEAIDTLLKYKKAFVFQTDITNNDYAKSVDTVLEELDKKDKVINLIINMILSYDIDEDICKQIGKLNCDKYKDGECGKCLKEYFYKKVEEENES